MYPLSLSMILLGAGLVTMAWESSRRRRNPLLTVLGLVLVAGGIASRLFGGAPIAATAAGLLADFGIGFLLAAAVLVAKKAKSKPFIILGISALILAGLFRLLGAWRAGADVEPGETVLLVELGPDDLVSEIVPLLEPFGATYEQAFPTVSLSDDEDLAQVYLVTVPVSKDRSVVRRLTSVLIGDSENVDHVEPNRTVALYPPIPSGRREALKKTGGLRLANDPLAESQWALDAAGVDGAHRILSGITPSRKAIVAILDTGVDARHEDIRTTFVRSPASDDAHGHGTHCAGIAGAATNNGVGMASLNWNGDFVEIASYRALSSSGLGTIESIAQSIIDATADGADVISMSLGDFSPKPPRVVRDAVEFALKRSVIVVAAAGNSNQDAASHMPSNIDGVIAVSAIDPTLRKAAFSNTNTTLKRPIAAPGVDILSLVPEGGYATKSGTSMATPLVAGLLGVLRSIQPDISAEAAYRILHETGREVEDSPRVGRVIDATAAIESLATRTS